MPILIGLVQSFVTYSYSILLHHRYGQTIGKKAVAIKVINSNESEHQIGVSQAIIRDIVPIFFDALIYTIAIVAVIKQEEYSTEYFGVVSLIWVIAELLTMLTNKKRRAVHDFLASTVVIRVKK